MVALLLAGVLALRMLVPAGYMIAATPGGWAVTLCSGMAPAGHAMAAMPGMAAHHAGERPPEHDRAEMPCAFAGLAAPALAGGADPVLMLAAIAFVMAIARAIARRRPIPPAPFLRPPLRGPPAVR